MSTRTRTRSRRSRSAQPATWLVWLDVGAIAAWGILLLKYWLTNQINLLLHPDYVWLAIAAGVFLVGVGVLKSLQLASNWRQQVNLNAMANMQHINVFPAGWGSALLLIAALIGWQFTPQPFGSQVALDRGVTDTLTMTRSQPQAFRGNVRPEERSLVEWVRTLNVYPEPDAYTGQIVNVDGFVIHRPDLPDHYLVISRFVITCCAADTYPVGMPVKLPQSRSAYPPDAWFRVEGEMITESLDGQRQLVIQAKSLTSIPEPENPYEY